MAQGKKPTWRIDLRARIVLLVVLAIIPFVVVLAFQSMALHREKTASIYEQATTLALKIAAYPKETVPDPRAYLVNLSRLPELSAPDQCAALLRLFDPALKVSPYFVALAVFKPNGERICPMPRAEDPVNLSDRDYFQRLVRYKTYTISELLTGRLSKKKSIIFSHPILDQQGELKYVINLALDVEWINASLHQAMTKMPLPSGVVAEALDNAGMIVAAVPAASARVGTQVEAWASVQPLVEKSQSLTREEVWSDGVRRATAYVPFFDSSNGSLRIRVGVPMEPAILAVERENTRRLMFTVCAALLALLSAWIVAERMLLKPLRKIWSAATALTRGDFSTRVAGVEDTGELGELALAFNSMADQIQGDRQRLHLLATQDPLTGLPNRYLIRERLAKAIETSLKSGSHGGVILLDLDGFKEINDSLGHPLGDRVLVRIAKVLEDVTNGRATAGRLGGDEFVVIMEGAQNCDAFEVLAHILRERICRPIDIDGQKFFLSVSMGIAVSPLHGTDVDTLLQNADVAMYRAKTERMPGYCLYSPAMNELASKRLKMQNLLRQATGSGELVLHYQPKFCAMSGAMTGAEALVRWNSKELGMVPPSDFIELAEQTGLIVEIGEWVLKTACLQLKEWKNVSPTLGEFSMAVNLSPRQFADPDLVSKVSAVLEWARIPAHQLELEITEGALLHNPAEAIVALSKVRELGTKVSVDDFGTGYSSLSYLKRLPIDALKIDKTFVAGLPADGRDHTIIRAVIAIARQLNIRVTAEGVETEGQLKTLKTLRCDELQGYYFSRPLPAPEFLVMLRDRESQARA